jgi:hypothetical protein
VISLNVNVRLTVSDKKIPMWRVKLFGWLAWLLRVPVDISDHVKIFLGEKTSQRYF